MATFKVLDVRKVPSVAEGRAGKLDFWVTYKLDEFRTYTAIVPKDTVTEEDIKAAVRADLESIERFTGKEFEL